jgi:hypothetical protein
MPPNQPYKFGAANMIAVEGEVDDWINLRRVLFVQGCIKYDDDLGKSHQTNFCSYLWLADHPHAWEACAMGNSAW